MKSSKNLKMVSLTGILETAVNLKSFQDRVAYE